ncbi:MAG: ARMT1-like domain-containing protein [Desulfobacterales bacterium]
MPQKNKSIRPIRAANPCRRASATVSNGALRVVYRPGSSPEQDAWFTAFFIENHLDHFAYPELAASPEQVRFMVFTEGEDRYYPCSSRMFDAIMSRKKSRFMTGKYLEVLDRTMALIRSMIEDPLDRQFLEALVGIKYHHEITDQILIPSRLEKRLMMIFLHRTQIEDPWFEEKAQRNRRLHLALTTPAFQNAMNRVTPFPCEQVPGTLAGIREFADYLELKRLLALAGATRLWTSDAAEDFTEQDYQDLFRHPIDGNGLEPLLAFLAITGNHVPSNEDKGRKILWLADEAGEIMVDLAIIRYLVKRGHKIILTVKEGPLFTKTDFADLTADPVLHRELEGVLVLREKSLGKNELVGKLRSDYDILAISDGTRENLNLLMVSTTFARAFKEVDAVISRGDDQRRRFFDTPFQFTQDIYNITATGVEGVEITFKPRHEKVIKFSHADLERKAQAIVDQMAAAKVAGMTVVFYSGIIGSIPGKIDMAKKIMSTFVRHLEKHSTQTFIINPSDFYEPGMDADDLMYMWEIVQRSGLIDIWRFQTYEDILTAFQILKQKVPPEWVGKDATFSTGCTKEMRIAADVQRSHPEMQIIGPSQEKFMRRDEYGIGKMFDRRFSVL